MRVPQVSERIKEAPAQALRGVFAGIGQLLLVTDKLRNKTPAGQDVRRARAPGSRRTAADTTFTSPAGRPGEATAPPAEPAAPASAAAASATAEPAAAASATAEPAAAASATAEPAAAASATAEAVTADADAASAAVTEKPAAAQPATIRRGPGPPAPTRRAPAGPAQAKPAAAEPPKPPKRQSTRDLDKTGNVRLLGADDNGSAPDAQPTAGPVPAGTVPADAVPADAGAPVAAAEPASGTADAAPPLPNYDELSVASLRARLRNLDVAQVRQLADYERAHAARADVLAMFERRIAKLEAEG